MTTRIAATAAVAILVCLAAPAEAKEKVYSPAVLPTGQKEISYYADWHQDSTQDVVNQELEFGWGLTHRDQVAAYGLWDNQSGNGVEYTGAKLEWIHALSENTKDNAWKFGTYLDYKISDTNGEDELEFRPLFEKPVNRTTLTLNGVFDKRVENWSEEGMKIGYAARWALDPWHRITSALEWYGDLGDIEDVKDWPETTQLLGPVIDYKVGRVAWQVGALFGLTQDSESVRVKTELALDW